MEDLQQLWNAHESAPFPSEIAGEEIEGEDLVSLDTFTAGCISNYLENQGDLDEATTNALTNCFNGLSLVLPHLSGEAKQYYSRLHEMSRSVIEKINRRE